MLGILYLIVIILPILFQFVYGRKAIYKTTSMKFGTISLISFAAQIIFSIIYFYIANYNFSKHFEEHPNETKCGMPLLAALVSLAFLIVVLIVLIIIQYFVNRYRKK
ncbi:hypothetical protein IRZ71_23385 [Flavobacterium sp. ANB]|uniref:hypothetical protein n=1 Tax=unclassified Flavobacterium TaxID=196869 RepID=UPI0012B6E2BF|nr:MULTISPECIES: hypothetical protein [unclassified Flavobacterium]MBF4519301.1 hypothetical protein [Flavobacterium sp. ANB]MTD72244.1 hypothetical protein [Flavobacterium sp. LC2016-13]